MNEKCLPQENKYLLSCCNQKCGSINHKKQGNRQ